MLRIAVVGAVESTLALLTSLLEAGRPPCLVVTLPDERADRHSDFVDLSEVTGSIGIPLLRTPSANDRSIVAELRAYDLDLLFVVGWSEICSEELCRSTRMGAIGFHPTLLPALRGRAALAWTILLDVRRTGATLFWLVPEMDAGDIAAQTEIILDGTEDLRGLMDRQLDALRAMVPPLLARLEEGERPALAQDATVATYVARRRPADGKVDWSRPASEIERLIRAVSRPYPGAFTSHGSRIMRIWRAELAAFPEWYAQPGQVFTSVDGTPVVRCGGGSDLRLLDFEIEGDGESGGATGGGRWSGQPVLGRFR